MCTCRTLQMPKMDGGCPGIRVQAIMSASMRVLETKQMFFTSVIAIEPSLLLATYCCWDRVFHWPETCQGGKAAGHWAPGNPLSQSPQQWHHKHAPHLTFLPPGFWESSWGPCDFSADTLHNQLSIQPWILFLFKIPGFKNRCWLNKKKIKDINFTTLVSKDLNLTIAMTRGGMAQPCR